MNTFYEKLRGEPASLVIMEDENGWKFGGMAHADWERNKSFYGSSETFVFTFRGGDSVQMWEASGRNDMFQFSDHKCIGFGGGTQQGRFALYLGDSFYRGNSIRTECFNNECLSSKNEFLCMEMEIWGFE